MLYVLGLCIDFDFTISNDHVVSKPYYLVNCIFPPLSHFVKTISVHHCIGHMGKEKYPTTVWGADHNLWFWHPAFRFTGSCNDIYILDASLLHKCFVDRTLKALLSCELYLPPSFSFCQNNLCPNFHQRKRHLLVGNSLPPKTWNMHLVCYRVIGTY